MLKIRSLRTAILAGAVTAVLVAGSTLASDGRRGSADSEHGTNGDHGNNGKVLDASLAGIPATLTGQTFMGAIGGGVAWKIDSGRARLSSGGQLDVRVRGLVLAAGASVGTNPIPTGRALVSCGGAVVAMSDSVPFSTQGDARVKATVTLPASCLAPVIFFAGDTAAGPRWFAVTGF